MNNPSRVKRLAGVRARMLLIVLLSGVTFLAYGVTDALQERARLLDDAKSRALLESQWTAVLFETAIADARTILENLVLNSALITEGAEKCHQYLRPLANLGERYAGFAIALPNGNDLCHTQTLKAAVNFADRVYFQKALRTKSFVIGDVVKSLVDGKPVLPMAVPAVNETGEVTAVAVVGFDVGWLYRLTQRKNLPEGLVQAVLDDQGHYLIRQGNAFEDRARVHPVWDRASPILNKAGEAVLEGKNLDGVEQVLGLVHVGGELPRALYVLTALPKGPLIAAANERFLRDLVVILILTVLTGAVVWFAGDFLIVRRVGALARAAISIGEGNLSARSGVAHGSDEIGFLARQFDVMADTLQEREEQLEKHTEDLQHLNRALRTLSGGNRILLSEKDEKALLDKFCKVAVEQGGYMMSWIGYAQDDAEKTVVPMAYAGLEKGFLTNLKASWDDNEFGRGPTGTAIRTGEASVVQDLATDPRAAPWRELVLERGYGSLCALPLKVKGQTMGALVMFASEPDAFTGEELELLTETADDLAFGIETIRERESRRNADERVRWLAYHDPETQLLNRTGLTEQLQDLISEASDRQQPLSVLAVELQNADALIDVFGHKGLDRIISATAQRMRDHLRSADIIARVHTRGLLAVLPSAGLEQAQEVANTFSKKLSDPIPVGGLQAEAEIRIGIAVFPGHGDKAQVLLRRAGLASRITASEGRVRVFDREIETHSNERLVLAAELRNAIEANQLCLFYQPKIRLADNQVIGAEALVRWRHPEKGLVPPSKFISIAEETGIITPMTEWVIKSAIRQAYQWKQVGLTQRIAVNVSARGFHDLALPQRLQRSLATWDLSVEFIGLELTESTLMEDVERALRVLTELRELGIEVAVDDFGTGYSSLRYLQRFPTNEIKLDYSFVRAAAVEQDALRIVQAVVRLTHDLGRKITAEGVENENVLALVRELGCDFAQGYYFAKPMPPDEWVKWLAKWESQKAA